MDQTTNNNDTEKQVVLPFWEFWRLVRRHQNAQIREASGVDRIARAEAKRVRRRARNLRLLVQR